MMKEVNSGQRTADSDANLRACLSSVACRLQPAQLASGQRSL
jgi:hypothetical protein